MTATDDDLQERLENTRSLVVRAEAQATVMKQEIAKDRAALADKERRYSDLRRSISRLRLNANRLAMATLPPDVRGRTLIP